MKSDPQIIPFPRTQYPAGQFVSFTRQELEGILRIYGYMVASGEWRDYAIDMLPDRAEFSVFRRTSENPLYKIIKDPSQKAKQGSFRIEGPDRQILKRHQELPVLLKFFNRKLVKLVK